MSKSRIRPQGTRPTLLRSGVEVSRQLVGHHITDRQKLEESLRESGEKYRSLIENNPAVSWTTDIKGNTIFISSNVERVYGYTPEEIHKRGEDLWFGQIHPDDVEKVKKAFKRLLVEGKQLDIEYQIRRKDGTWIWLEDKSLGTYEKDGVLYADGIFLDITDRKTAEKELAKSELILNAMGEALIAITPNGKIVRVNTAYCNLWGFKPEEVIGQPTSMNFPKEEWRKHQKEMKQVLVVGGVRQFKTIALTKNGERIPIELSGTVEKNEQGRVVGLIAVVRDISDRERTEMELRESEEKFRTLSDASFEGIVITNQGRILSMNTALKKILGYRPDEIMEKEVRMLVALEDREMVTEKIQSGYEKPYEHKALCKNGSVIDVEVCGRHVLYQGQKCRITALRDITERKRAEEALHQKNIALGEVIAQIKVEENKIKEDIARNVEELILPLVKKLRVKGASKKYTELLENELKELGSSFGRKITEKSMRLTAREIEICSMIKNGLTTKEIAGLLNLSFLTVSKHRENIRKKLRLSGTDANLVSYLKQL